MKKKAGIIILIVAIIVIILTGVMMFTNLGQEVRSYLYYQFGIPKETVTIEEPEHIKITYTYRMSDESFDIDITDKELIKMIVDSISNKRLNNETKAGIMLLIMGDYTVDLGNDISFKFDSYHNGYIEIYDNEKHFITQITPEVLKKIEDIVDVRLTENVQRFQTEKITVTNKKENKINIERKSAIEYILNQCKNIYTKEIDSGIMLDIAMPDYIINFNNGISILKYNETDQGFLVENEKYYYVYGLSVLDTIIENVFDDIEEKEQMFNTNKITITRSDKSIEIINEDIIEKITTSMIYSDIQEKDWLNDYDITEEYNNGLKIKMNNYELLIPGKIGTVTIGNRYIISESKKIKLCFPLYDLEQYANELLENADESKERIVMVNGKLYYDTKIEDTTTGRCGTMDGHITSHVNSNELPTIDNQANFEGDYEYQYGSENTIELCIDGKWIIFEAKT